MYPVFAHCYLSLIVREYEEEAKAFLANHWQDHIDYHKQDIEKLRAVTTEEHMAQSDYVQTIRCALGGLIPGPEAGGVAAI